MAQEATVCSGFNNDGIGQQVIPIHKWVFILDLMKWLLKKYKILRSNKYLQTRKYRSKKLEELLNDFFVSPEDFGFTLAVELLLESKVVKTVEVLGLHCLEYGKLFDFSFNLADTAALLVFADSVLLSSSPAKSMFSLYPSARCSDFAMVTCIILCFSTWNVKY